MQTALSSRGDVTKTGAIDGSNKNVDRINSSLPMPSYRPNFDGNVDPANTILNMIDDDTTTDQNKSRTDESEKDANGTATSAGCYHLSISQIASSHHPPKKFNSRYASFQESTVVTKKKCHVPSDRGFVKPLFGSVSANVPIRGDKIGKMSDSSETGPREETTLEVEERSLNLVDKTFQISPSADMDEREFNVSGESDFFCIHR
ncbi:unnamed protein product [Protopolystoma xenopodis]|uniref:Uncharacterized protein n=1 Tax=Protopolystoma xenopodis TaxID=117903 RepID=A0A448WER8_9PLAT|nr:unnamed protein product [Protopolystoma xenopodis]